MGDVLRTEVSLDFRQRERYMQRLGGKLESSEEVRVVLSGRWEKSEEMGGRGGELRVKSCSSFAHTVKCLGIIQQRTAARFLGRIVCLAF